jgi:dienelactone hydrolase
VEVYNPSTDTPHPAVSTVEEYDIGLPLDCVSKLEPINFNSHGSKLSGYFSRAKGQGPHPTIIYLHGAPGGPKVVLGLAEKTVVAGWNALVFNYRGFWNSEGIYTLKNSREDVFSAKAFLRSDKIVKKYSVDPNHIALAGYSFGAALALTAATNDPALKYVLGIAPGDMAWLARKIEAEEEFKTKMIIMLDKQFDGPIKGSRGKQAVEELVENADMFDLVKKSQISFNKIVIAYRWMAR